MQESYSEYFYSINSYFILKFNWFLKWMLKISSANKAALLSSRLRALSKNMYKPFTCWMYVKVHKDIFSISIIFDADESQVTKNIIPHFYIISSDGIDLILLEYFGLNIRGFNDGTVWQEYTHNSYYFIKRWLWSILTYLNNRKRQQ